MSLPLPRPPLPPHIIQMLALSVEEFEHKAEPFTVVLRAQGKIDDYQREIDRIARAAFEAGIQFVKSSGRAALQPVPPKDAA